MIAEIWIHDHTNDRGSLSDTMTFMDTMKFVTVVDKENNGFFCYYFFMASDEMSHFSQVANQKQNCNEIVFGTFG
jgi:hypothetical protein